MLDRLCGYASRVLLAASAAALAAMVTILTWQVFARYVLGSSPAWAEQAALLLMIWMTFLGTAAGIGMGFHIRIVEGIAVLPAKWQRRMIRLAHVVTLFAGVLMAWIGAELVSATWTNSVPTLPLTRGMVYTVIPLAGAITVIFTLQKLARGEADLTSVSAA